MLSYVNIIEDQEAPVEEIKDGELNQPVRVPELEPKKCYECSQNLPLSYTTPTDEPWATGIFDCAEDPESCKTGLFCPCVLQAKNTEAIRGVPWKRACVLHACYIGTCISLIASIGIFHGAMTPVQSLRVMTDGLFGALGISAAYTGVTRDVLQRKFHLKNSPCLVSNGLAVHFCLPCCAACQEHREMKRHIMVDNAGKTNTVTTAPRQQEMISTASSSST